MIGFILPLTDILKHIEVCSLLYTRIWNESIYLLLSTCGQQYVVSMTIYFNFCFQTSFSHLFYFYFCTYALILKIFRVDRTV